MIATLVILVLSCFLLFVFIGVRREGADQKRLFESIKELEKGIEQIGKIEYSKLESEDRMLASEFIRLECLSRVFKYSKHEAYWIEFILTNSTNEKLSFEITSVKITQSGHSSICDTTLILEKVSEYIAPPYGNAYFDTSMGLNFSLGANAPKNFIFTSRFKRANAHFTESDYLIIEVLINKNIDNTGKQQLGDAIHFKDYFKNLKFKTIQSIDDEIHWEKNDH